MFKFISDSNIREIIEDYWNQALLCNEHEAYAAVIVLCGGILEGILAWGIIQHEKEAREICPNEFRNKDGSDKPVNKWSLTPLIKVANKIGIIGKTSNRLLNAAQDFRNFIHPYNVISQSARPNSGLADISIKTVQEVCRSLSGRILIKER